MTLTDTHCHLYFNKFDDDRVEVIARATEAGVTRILVPGITRETSLASVKLADAHPTVFAAIGIHPTDALTWTEDTRDYLRKLAQNPRVKAIGEIGLDYYWDAAPHDLQKKILREQLSLAEELGLPVVLHLREKDDAPHGNCAEDLLTLLEDWVENLGPRASSLAISPGVLHSFSGTSETAYKAIELGFMIGVTGPVTFKNAAQRREVISSIPIEHLLIETDAPFLAPHPHRGQRNEPAYVALVAEKVAELYAKTPAEIAEITSANAARLFNW
ncbi:MAG: TatD family hydrolase [Anaerolineae bacterium]|nr:TatD family hydrolase [Anaerolineae bacterium]MBT7069988.1 TatD family hydrolase [Anaerolineae bacterium]MBT7325692.1 TatD family hydrolase [Anaerolineae bacterium]